MPPCLFLAPVYQTATGRAIESPYISGAISYSFVTFFRASPLRGSWRAAPERGMRRPLRHLLRKCHIPSRRGGKPLRRGFGRPMATPTDVSGVRRWTEHTKPGPSRLRRPRRDTKYKTFGPWQDCTPFSECAPHPLPAQPARKRLPHGTQGGLLSAAWFPT